MGCSSGSTPTTFLLDGNLTSSPKELAEIQNNYFMDKVDTLIEALPSNDVLPDPLIHLKSAMNRWEGKNQIEKLKFKVTTEDDVMKLIRKLKNSSSYGNDKIDAKTIKITSSALITQITRVINLSIQKSTFPNKWRIGKVVPLYKGKQLNQLVPSSYRPISLLPLISKLTERIIQSQLTAHFDNNKLWNHNLHGYRKNRSSTTTLLQVADMLYEAADAKEIADIITIDESAAFNSVEHQLLLDKLQIYGLEDSALNWLRSYLYYRTQYVTIGGQNSSMKNVKRGVPQGSVLGPILFSIFTNKLSESTKDTECSNIEHTEEIDEDLFGLDCKVCGITPSYADNSNHVTISKNREQNQQLLASNLNKISNFLESNQLTVNQSKTQILETMVPQKRSKLTGNPPIIAVLDNKNRVQIIEAENNIRILGMNIGNNLNWNAHLKSGDKPLLSSINSKLGSLNLLKKELPRTARHILANGLIIAKLQYMIPVWGGLPNNKIRKLQTILNSTARFVTGMKRNTSSAKLMANCNWLFASELVRYHTLLTLWRTITDTQHNYFDTRIMWKENLLLETTTPRLKTTKNSFRWRSVRQWNLLTLETRSSHNTASFKRALRKEIINDRILGKPQ